MTPPTTTERSPVVAIMGHVDHGKSSLLDYIRKTNIVDGEAGGITQHIGTYEVELDGGKRITFLDTPGHAAFDTMRHRGGSIADIAILIVSAEDGVKTQTKHAIEVIKKNNIPFIVAINKIDKPAAQPEKVKTELLEEGIYVEGYGGDVPVNLISAKAGTGVDDLLESLLILAEMEEMKGQPEKLATGFVIESHRDPKEGISATMVIKDGSISKGQFVVVDDSVTPTRMLRDFAGNDIDTAYFSSPIQLVGFNKLPSVGSRFATFETKKDAEQAILEFKDIEAELREYQDITEVPEGVALIPVILKTDVAGTGEAIREQIEKMTTDDVIFKIIKCETGSINESDVKLSLSDLNTVIIGFHVEEDANIKNLNEYDGLTIKIFDIIYKLTEWCEELYEERRIKKQTDTVMGSLKVLKTFSHQKGQALVGGTVTEGTLAVGEKCKFMNKDGNETGRGIISGIQQGKQTVERVSGNGTECGIMITTDHEVVSGEQVVTFVTEIK
ncbi:translation initiation factor IF-2 [Patescibacteria group bacterium]|nr:translation initiation factor IF-2 [Patescibacteria group bacterium]